MDATVEVTLLSVDGLDEFEERKILLAPNKDVPVGRSSKNAQKNLLAGPDNAFINSPVISREHATLSTSSNDSAMSLQIPNVYITDNGSMHGTYVNGDRLDSGVASKLRNGDLLRFGDNVVRDQDSFIAKKYSFSSRLPPSNVDRSFPRGISVPDNCTSDDEDIDSSEAVRSSPNPPSYGSQANPVNVDDFEDMPRQRFGLGPEDRGLKMIRPSPPTPANKDVSVSQTSSNSVVNDYPTDSVQFDLVENNSSDDEEEVQDYPDEEEDDRSMSTSDIDNETEDEEIHSGDEESVDNSDLESVSASDGSDEDLDEARRVTMGAMLNHEEQKTAMPTSGTLPTHVSPAQTSPNFAAPQSVQAFTKLPDPPTFHQTTSAPAYSARPALKELDSDKFRDTDSMFSDSFDNTWENSVGASMVRPAAPKPTTWDSLDFHMPVLMREAPSQNTWFEDSPTYMFPTNNYGRDSMPAFNTTHAYAPPSFVESSTPAPVKARPQNPFSGPHTLEPLMNAPVPPSVPDEIIETPTRTKVSIAEIVEDAPQQPPTPTSVSSPPSLKRKADVLDEPVVEELSPAPVVVSEPTVVAAPAPSEAPAVSEAPAEPSRKKARSGLSPLASGIAGFLLGGATIVSALSCIPEWVFE